MKQFRARLVHRLAAVSPLTGFVTLAHVLGGLATIWVAPALYRPEGHLPMILLAVGLILIGLLMARHSDGNPRMVAADAAYACALIGTASFLAVDGRVAVGEAAVAGLVATFPAMRLAPRAALAMAAVVAAETAFLVHRSGLTGPALPTLAVTMSAMPLIPTLILLSFRRQLDVTLTQLRLAAMSDELTGLANRRGLTELAPIVFSLAQRSGGLVAVLIADIDRFKQYNDTYGHLHGDEVLRSVAHLIRGGVRPSDVVARLGGEELCVVAAIDHEQRLAELAERVRGMVQDGGDGVTVSVGAAARRVVPGGDVETTLWSLIDDADVLLYQAKDAGRNAVRVRALTPT